MSFNDKKLCCSTMNNFRQHCILHNSWIKLWWIFSTISWHLLKEEFRKGFWPWMNWIGHGLEICFHSAPMQQRKRTKPKPFFRPLWNIFLLRWRRRECSYFTEIVKKWARSKYQNYFTPTRNKWAIVFDQRLKWNNLMWFNI